MAAQLDSLAGAAELPNVALRVVPFTAGLHHGVMSGPFVILRFPLNGDGHESEPATVYVDGFTGALYLDKPREVERYTERIREIWAAAASEATSSRLIRQSVKDIAGR